MDIYINIMEEDNIVDNIINQERIEPTEEELETFKNLVNDWFKYDDQIRKLKMKLTIVPRHLLL
jgi:hypothetical protein